MVLQGTNAIRDRTTRLANYCIVVPNVVISARAMCSAIGAPGLRLLNDLELLFNRYGSRIQVPAFVLRLRSANSSKNTNSDPPGGSFPTPSG